MPGVADEPVQGNHTSTLRHPPYSYLSLALQTASSSRTQQSKPLLDEITVRQYLAYATQQFLGLTGAAIPTDVLKVDGPYAWVRVPYEDCDAVVAALSQWTNAAKTVSLRVVVRSSWLGGINRVNDERKFWSLDS